MTAATTVLLCMLGAVSLTGNLALRLGCDLAALAVLVAYLGSPALLGHPGVPWRSSPGELPGAQAQPGRYREPELQKEPG